MSQEYTYPKDIDQFTTKKNHILDVYGNITQEGDEVLAEHINDLQNAIVSVEETLGTDPQGTYQSVASRLDAIKQANMLKIPSMHVQIGLPTDSISELIDKYVMYNYVLFGQDNLNDTVIEETTAFKVINGSDKTVYMGQIQSSAPVNDNDVSLIKDTIYKWSLTGAQGIALEPFDYTIFTRTQQNELLNYAHSLGLFVVMSGIPEDIFGNTFIAGKNESNTPIAIQEKDKIFIDNFSINNGVYETLSALKVRAEKYNNYRVQFKVDVLARFNATTQEEYHYANTAGMMYSVDVLACTNVTRFNSIPLFGEYYSNNPNIVVSGTTHRRTSSTSIFELMPEGKHAIFGQRIPADFIDPTLITIDNSNIQDIDASKIKTGSILAARMAENVIEAINAEASFGEINLEHVPDMNVGKIRDAVADVFNSTLNTSEFLEQLADSIVNIINNDGTVSFSLDRLKANVVAAINGYFSVIDVETIYINGAYIENLDATNITTGTLKITDGMSVEVEDRNIKINNDGLSITRKNEANVETGKIVLTENGLEIAVPDGAGGWTYTTKLTPDRLVVENADIENINADKITAGDIDAQRIIAGVITAVSAKIGEIIADVADIEKADIKELSSKIIDAVNIYAEYVQATDAKFDSAVIGELTADHIQATVIDAINANITGTARIEAAVIGDLTAAHIQAEVIEAIRIAVGDIVGDTATFQNMIAAVIQGNVINTSEVNIVSMAGVLTNLVTNTTLGENANGWIGGLYIATGGTSGEADGFLRVDTTAYSPTIAVTPGKEYNFTVYAKKIGSDRLVVDAVRTSGDIGSETVIDKEIDSEWRRYAGKFTVPVDSGTTSVVLNFSTGTPGSTIGVDHLIVNEKYNGALLTIDNAGLIISSLPKVNLTDTYWPIGAKVLIMDKNGISISDDGGRTPHLKIAGDKLFVTNADIDTLEANKLTAGTIDASKSISFKSQAGAAIDKNALVIDNDGILVTDTGDIATAKNAVLMDKNGISIRSRANVGDAWPEWDTRISATGIKVLNADIQSLSADKVTAGNITANGSITIGEDIILSDDTIQVGAGITIGNDAIQISDKVTIGKFIKDALTYWGLKITTDGGKVITLDKDGLQSDNFKINSDGTVNVTGNINAASGTLTNLSVDGTITVAANGKIDTDSVEINNSGLIIKPTKTLNVNNNFIVDSNGHATLTGATISGAITATSGEFVGTVKSSTGFFGDALNQIVIDSQGLVLGTGSIVDARTNTKLKLDAVNGLTVKKGTIGSITITDDGLSAGGVLIKSTGIEVSGANGILVTSATGIIVSDGKIIIKDGTTNLIEMGTVGSLKGIKVNTTSPITIDSDGIKSTNFHLNASGNLTASSATITGTINAVSGYFGNSNVIANSGGILVNAGGSIKAGTTVTLDTNGLTITNGTAGINVNSVFTVSGAGALTATSGTIGGITLGTDRLTAGTVIIHNTGLIQAGANVSLGLIGASQYGLKVSGANPITIDATGISSTNFSVGVNGTVSVNGSIYSTSGYFGTVTNGVHINSTGLAVVGTGHITGNGFDLSSSGLKLTGGSGDVIDLRNALNEKIFTVDNLGTFTAKKGFIGSLEITEDLLVGGGSTFGAEGITVKDGATDLVQIGAFLDFKGIKINTANPITIGTGGIQSENFKINSDGSVVITGAITATSGTFTGTVQSASGYFGTTIKGVSINADGLTVIGTGRILAGNSYISSAGIYLGSDSSIILGTSFSANSTGMTAIAGYIGGWKITANTLEDSAGKIIMDHAQQNIRVNNGTSNVITIGKSGTDYGIFAYAGRIGGWVLDDKTLTSGNIILRGDDVNSVISIGTNIVLRNNGSATLGKLEIASDGSISSTNFSINASGNASFNGTLSSPTGNIGSWVIGTGILKSTNDTVILDAANEQVVVKNASSVSQVILGKYTGGYGVKAGNTTLDANGITAAQGTVGGWTLAASTLKSGNVTLDATNSKITIGTAISINNDGSAKFGNLYITTNGSIHSGSVYATSPFKVDGVTGNAEFSGKITSASGEIAGWTIGATSLSKNNVSLNSSGTITLGASSQILLSATTGIKVSTDKFTVDLAGNMVAQLATITGTVNATAGYFGTSANGVNITSTGLKVNGDSGIIENNNTKMTADGITVYDGVVTALILGKYATDKYGLYANSGSLIIDKNGILIDGGNSAINMGYNSGTSSYNFQVLADGNLKAKNADIQGKITAITGAIGGWTLGDTTLTGGAMTLSSAGFIDITSVARLDDNGLVLRKADGNPYMTLSRTGISSTNFTYNSLTDSISLTGTIHTASGDIGGWSINADSISSGNIVLDKTGIISVGTAITLDAANGGKLTVGNIEATGGKIGGWNISGAAIVDNVATPNMTIAPTLISIKDQVKIGNYTGASWGIKAGNTTLNASGITAAQGTIGGITINESSISSSGFTLNSNGLITASNVNLTGIVQALSGTFGTAASRLTASADGIYTGDGVGAANSAFWIAAQPIAGTDIVGGDAFFKGSLKVSHDSVVEGGNIILQSGAIIAGDLGTGHVRMSYDPVNGPEIYSQALNANSVYEKIFSVNKNGAYFKGDITATTGSILGDLSVGSDSSVYLSGTTKSILLYDTTNENSNRVVRLNNMGLYYSEDGGSTYSPAMTAGGINANAINDGELLISDHGSGASGIRIRQWDTTKSAYVDNVQITPSGINVLNGAITVFNDQTGEVLIGGGYLRVKGLDMGVVTSNNYIGNGNFNMVSEKFGIKQLNDGEVFLGRAQSSGGAVSNPTYHYAGWPDHGERDPHTIWTYKLNPDGTMVTFDIENDQDPNYPNIVRSSFNPQWSAVHPNPAIPYCVVPADADNFITVIDKNGNIVRQMKAWKGGLFGAAFTPLSSTRFTGNRMVVCGDDIDRKRAPWDVVVYDTTNADPNLWNIIGVIPVGEFPSKVVCDNNGYAYVTVSLDNAIYKLDIVNMRVESIMHMTDVRGIPVIPLPIGISPDYSKLYVGGVITDFVYEVPTSFATPFLSCKKLTVTPYLGNRGIIHDLRVLSDGRLITSSASTTDACITLIDFSVTPTIEEPYSHIVTYIDANADLSRLAIPAAPDQGSDPTGYAAWLVLKSKWNFFSSTTLNFHPTLPIIYVTITNRCMVSVLDYSSGEFVELQRIPSGSNCSGISISVDATRCYVPSHHYHTYPLGANRVWGYDATTNFYATDDVFDTTQKYWHQNPSGMVMVGNSIWVANRATNRIAVIDINNWSNDTLWQYVNDVGNKPYELKLNHAKTKLFVSNDDSNNEYDPDFVTIIDVATKQIDNRIYVADRPIGIEISADDKYLYIACKSGKMVQKANISTRRIIDSVSFESEPTHLKLVGNNLYVTCFDTDNVYCLDANTLDILSTMQCDKDPTQMVVVGGKLYVVNQGYDNIMVFDIATNTMEKRIQVGSRPKPIAYNSVKNLIYVGNSGEGSVCIINPTTNEVVEWCMTGDNPEYILVSDDGSKWYVSAHGPEDIVSYGVGTPFTGDAYIDNGGNTHKYGASYWVPSRSEWTRGVDNTLTSFSSVEFWPQEEIQGKQGYSHLTVMGMYDAFARVEQDVYPLNNNSDGACEYKTELVEIEESQGRLLSEDAADFRNIAGAEKKRISVISATDGTQYVEDAHYEVNYETNLMSLKGSVIPPSRVRRNTTAINTDPIALMSGGSAYNTIEVYAENQTENPYEEGVDYTINRTNNTITRLVEGSIPANSILTILYRHLLKVRYYYHPNKRNYSDVVLSADLFWRWPRPENQTVRMQIDELVPKFINADNDNIEPWQPTLDYGRGYYNNVLKQWEHYNADSVKLESIPLYKGVVYSGISNRATNASFSSSTTPISGTSIDAVKVLAGIVELPGGTQSITGDLGATYYVNEIQVIHAEDGRTVYDAKVEVSIDGSTWQTVYDNTTSPCNYTVNFTKTINSETYLGPRRIKYVKLTSNQSSAGTTNQWKQVKVMGDWKVNQGYTFSSNTIWDSEGKKEVYLTLVAQDLIRFDDPTLRTDPQNPLARPNERVRYRTYYTAADGELNIRGTVQAFSVFDEIEYVGLRSDLTPEVGQHIDFTWDYVNNTMQRTVDSDIADGEEIRIVYKYVQENLSNLPLCVGYKNPMTGALDSSIPSSVAETDSTGAWMEWEFENEYRCDWYIGWIADIGLGMVNIYLDNKLIHSISQSAAKVERFSQLSQDLLPGKHKIRLVQQQGRVNFDVIKLEDLQLFYLNSNIVASPAINPVELFSWYPAKITPIRARKYIGRGSQTMSGAYETLRTDKELQIPNNQVPVKYRVRFATSLEGRGEPTNGEGSYGGEAVGNEFKFERGSVMITNVTLEEGINPTYWRMSPSEDKYAGYQIEQWDSTKPTKTGIQRVHLANGIVDGDKLKSFSIIDSHVANNAGIQESKLALNYDTHPHTNKTILDQIIGWGTSGITNVIARADHTHPELANGVFNNALQVNGDLTIDGNITASGRIRELNQPSVVHARPLYGVAGDLEFQTDVTTWDVLCFNYNLFAYACPGPEVGAVRKYRLYAVYSDNIEFPSQARARLRIRTDASTPSTIYEWTMNATWGDMHGRRDAYSDLFTAEDLGNHHYIEVRIQNDAGNFVQNPVAPKEVAIDWLELIAYDIFEE